MKPDLSKLLLRILRFIELHDGKLAYVTIASLMRHVPESKADYVHYEVVVRELVNRKVLNYEWDDSAFTKNLEDSPFGVTLGRKRRRARMMRISDDPQAVLDKLSERLAKAKRCVEDFKLNLTTDPYGAMEAANAVFSAAAILRVFETAVHMLTTDDGDIATGTRGDPTKNPMAFLVEYAQREVQNITLHPQRSSSQTSNMMYHERATAWAKVLDIVMWY